MADQDQIQQAQAEEEQRQAMEERKHLMLQSLLTPEAKERLSRISLVKPELADSVSQQIIAMANRGAITEKISEHRLKQMLETNSESSNKKGPKITFQRKKYDREEEEEEYDL